MSVSSISAICFPSPDVSIPLSTCDRITQIVGKSMQELLVSLAIGLVVSQFVVSAAGASMICSAVMVQFAVSLVFRSLGAFCESWRSFSEWVNAASFAVFTGCNAQSLVHEWGHAGAALLMYKNPRPSVFVNPFLGGLTRFYKTALSSWGKMMGPAAATCFVVASGPLLTLLISSALLCMGMALREKYPELSKYLIGCALFDFLSHVVYAYGALEAKPWDLTHDFVHLSIFGLDPVVAAVGIAAIPVFIILGMQKKPPELPQAAAMS